MKTLKAKSLQHVCPIRFERHFFPYVLPQLFRSARAVRFHVFNQLLHKSSFLGIFLGQACLAFERKLNFSIESLNWRALPEVSTSEQLTVRVFSSMKLPTWLGNIAPRKRTPMKQALTIYRKTSVRSIRVYVHGLHSLTKWKLFSLDRDGKPSNVFWRIQFQPPYSIDTTPPLGELLAQGNSPAYFRLKSYTIWFFGVVEGNFSFSLCFPCCPYFLMFSFFWRTGSRIRFTISIRPLQRRSSRGGIRAPGMWPMCSFSSFL